MIYVFEHHDRLLSLWREQDRREIRLAHIDFHDDLRGLLIDRVKGCTYPIRSLACGEAAVDPGNFLAHAVLEGRVESVRWVHGAIGGRAYDMGIVRYESDLFALPQRLRQALTGTTCIPLEFEESLLDDWGGPTDTELLSIDWDCFASILLDAGGIEQRASGFLDRLGTQVPQDSYVCYSPEYSHPSLDAFRGFVKELSSRFDQPVDWVEPGLAQGRTRPAAVETELPSGPLGRLILALRRRGIY